ncbi:AMP-binding protein [Mycolicibacterium neoaurum]|uniref:Acyl-CoA synthetase n=1 Tax=Mycolicibacterium neoaurum VKM Ac-1815D TaxID=700508 RepID=V5XDT2_MYCNE|nr:acyl-CoA synthetase [Mycolicibacterium neoaurum VKM Ac-1815D]AMO06005.1 acyl-CoA synthetase [Mycolicibacterium neoaurum]AXK75662.1 acyl-CoA synthetase [Mycolicibacterium neoaurum]KJQ50482.1 acyl-CoA synthetase [Mycolicibacterium neoaurum]KUM09668.1 acyl-CoA synthetase [Mycolicibacterium neoaurum]
MSDTNLIGVLRERASLQPEDIAYTFMDYDHEWDGVATTLTWSQLYRRVRNLASEMRQIGQLGDRAVILAPQSLEYVIGFLASLEAGIIAVPLSVPMVGQHDERVSAVIKDSTPAIILTTSSVAATVAEYAKTDDGAAAATVIEVDALDLEARRKSLSSREQKPETAYLQYTSGSTRTPAGVMVTHRNLTSNFEQMMCAFFPHFGKVPPSGAHVVSWLPFYHDMGLLLGIVAPVLGGWSTVFTTPLSFLARPARWIQLMGSYPRVVTGGPNFAFELAAGRTTDEDLDGIDLSDVIAVYSGAERVHEATLKRFSQRFAKFNFDEGVIRPSYGLAEATLFVGTGVPGPPSVVSFDPEKLSAGVAERTADGSGTKLVGYGRPEDPVVRIVDAETLIEVPAGGIGEIWSHGENNCLGYWDKPEQTEHTFGGMITNPSEGTPAGPWLRTGDLGFLSDGELFIIGRIKDLLIVRGSNHYPDDIEATIQEITGGRVAAIAVDGDRSEQLVAIIEVKKRGDSEAEVMENLLNIKRSVASAVSQTHGIAAADLVLVPRGAIPITTSGKIRRQSCVQKYRDGEFARLDENLQTV